MAKPSEAMECRIVGRLAREPEATRTLSGTTICRMFVSKQARGPASSPTRVGLYLRGELAERCRDGLHEGDLITALGELAERRGSDAPRFPEVLVEDRAGSVKLHERAGSAA